MRLDVSAMEKSFAGQVDDYAGLFGAGADMPDMELPTCTDKETKELMKNKKGTTTLAFIFDKGVIVAADSQASMGGYI
ncbi:hypothetical protein GUJ93_ZPchr0002g23418 [Zizania palustris]|uniref:Proteasome subunit beta n=1 Tax=Zizania palustris TaxID=103762 RepID=A0A8J5RSJ2_ZIZPA|nr:hypothetical protein GUJ93_ZPchr0002g23418 [Zizania palustris]